MSESNGGGGQGAFRVGGLKAEYEELVGQLMDPAIHSDRSRLRKVSRRHKQLEEIFAAAGELDRAADDLEAAEELMADLEDSEREIMGAELSSARERARVALERLEELLLPPDPNDGRDVIVEIRGAEGGEEANLFAKDLFGMYTRFAERLGWKVELLEATASEMGGYDEVAFVLRGEGVWRRMKHEAGTHRVQRVPVTESQGRVHTSSATVVVLPEADEVEVNIDPSELKIDVYRATGPGGQSVNTTDSAVRITHLPTGTVVAMQDEKSQLQNKAKALAVLRARLLAAEQERQAAEASAARRAQVGGGGRSEKIRTYNFKENRVTDHRVKVTLHKLDRILGGELEELSDALLAAERAAELQQAR